MTFKEFLQAEGFGDYFRGSMKPIRYISPLSKDPKYADAFAAFVQRNNGDEKAAEAEWELPANQWKRQRSGMIQEPISNEPDPFNKDWRAKYTSGPDMVRSVP